MTFCEPKGNTWAEPHGSARRTGHWSFTGGLRWELGAKSWWFHVALEINHVFFLGKWSYIDINCLWMCHCPQHSRTMLKNEYPPDIKDGRIHSGCCPIITGMYVSCTLCTSIWYIDITILYNYVYTSTCTYIYTQTMFTCAHTWLVAFPQTYLVTDKFESETYFCVVWTTSSAKQIACLKTNTWGSWKTKRWGVEIVK